ncbi:hypothetical protein [Thiohalocapsa sp. ML1]|uniref:hypothetical protein n=1 Tax=Thiohalocapsa sp. ML1 TaxID=1431688 RepID=UPI001C1FAEFA|nr:hypothetical protein [Thiohalocapsa sp. ML1]
MLTVRRLIMEGHRPLAERVNNHRIKEAKAAGKEPVLTNATDLLLRQMGANSACHGEIALTANDLLGDAPRRCPIILRPSAHARHNAAHTLRIHSFVRRLV